MADYAEDKFQISRISIHSVDGGGSRARVMSIEAANAVLNGWARQASGCMPVECEVEILYEDGLRYCTRYQLEQEQKVSLGRDVRRCLKAMITPGARNARRNRHPVVCGAIDGLAAKNPADSARTMLEHYSL